MKTTGIIMGVGAPNDSIHHGKTFCAIILTEQLGFIRIYPIPAESKFPVWGNVEIDIEKGNDPREESWRVKSFVIGDKITDNVIKREILNRCCIKSGMSDPMDFQNEMKKSIFMVKPSWGDGMAEVSLSHKIPDVSPDDEDCGWIVTQGKHWLKPYLKWFSDQGKSHTTHLGGREIYEGIRNNPTQPWNVMNNIRVSDPEWEHWMLMGNMKDKRNVWLCVHLHRLKKEKSGSIPLFSHPIIGNDLAWPYKQQETSNVEIVDGHPMLFTMKDIT